MNLVNYSLKNRVTVLFFMFILIVGGVLAYTKMGKLEDPTFTIKTAMVVTAYPGASAHEVDQQVTRVVERAIQAAEEVESIKSLSRPGQSIIWVNIYEYNRTDKIQQLWDILRRRVGEVQGKLPPQAGPPIVMDDYSDVFGIFLALTGEGFSYAELKDYAEFMKRELVLVKDVKRINLVGERTEVINVGISRAKCSGAGISPVSIVKTLSSQNRMLASGAVNCGDARVRISETGSFEGPKDIENLIISSPGGAQIRLDELARVSRAYLDPPEPFIRFNGKPAIGLAISAANGANVVEMGLAVENRIEQMSARLPVGLEVHEVYFQSKFVKRAINAFLTNLGESVGIVLAVLLITMGIRSGLIISANLILSILATLVVMFAWGIDLQRVSLAALILVMGMIVDNAIVVVDGALTGIKKGEEKEKSISGIARQTALPLLGSTVIAALAFIPIYLAPINTGEYCASLFQVVAIALMASWVLAMTQTPVFGYYLLKVKPGKKTITDEKSLFHCLYKTLLRATLRHRLLTLLVMLVFLASGFAGLNLVSKIFFADSDKPQFFIDYRLPQGSRIQALSRDLAKAEKYISGLKEVKNHTACLGQSAPRFAAAITPEPHDPAYGQIVVSVHDYRKIDELAQNLEKWFAQNLPRGELHITKYISGPKSDYRVEARFTGPDPKVLRDLAEKTKHIMKKSGLAKNITDDWKQRILVLKANYSQQKGPQARVERKDLTNTLLSLTDGLTVTSFRENDKLIPIKVRLGDANLEKLAFSPVWGSQGRATTMGQVTNRQSLSWEDPIVRRYNRRRVIRAQCDPVEGVTSNGLLEQIQGKIEALPLPEGYHLEWEGEKELSDKGNKGVGTYLPLSLILMLVILVMLFNGVRQPLIIALVVPLATVGMAAGLLITGEPFGFLAMLGAYSLIGMLIKNAVVLLDQIKIETQAGKPALRAVIDSSVGRMRPVLMASITTILGMIPLLTDAMFSSMAVTIMFGLAFATILTLIVVPVLYTLFFGIKTKAA
ncbi:efflux RND transporter permease subunit [Dethiosulfatarculus sandiegensis]|uniref:Multidrug transporter AcrB n=1 Tax=Dethiosulfatarculus sandiegensis TaxID=1429043 RepID=A0A0D2HJL7_9BACT|nr:efflux RND transporter permease subunit [Dethiosulfatarculus sandiegensis]KIX10848.1 multidrug transporter AcrB [Dethiosulfatarculus sandiegensis]